MRTVKLENNINQIPKKFVSYNVNGIRGAMNRGLVQYIAQVNADVIGLQEVKATKDQIDHSQFEDLGYKSYWHPAVKKGYSGVAIFSKIDPIHIEYGMGINSYDDEGRIIRADFDGFSFVNAYFPSGTSGSLRQDFKYLFLDDILGYTQDLRRDHPNLIMSGDYNICHKPIDIHNPISNKNSSGFLPEEREWMDRFVGSGFVDSFRIFNSEPHHYTWWSYRANARNNNKGWRIDYHMASAPMSNRIRRSIILPDAIHSDHCPLLLEID